MISTISGYNGFEGLNKQGMYSNSRVLNRRVSRADWNGIVNRLTEVGCSIIDIQAAYSSNKERNAPDADV